MQINLVDTLLSGFLPISSHLLQDHHTLIARVTVSTNQYPFIVTDSISKFNAHEQHATNLARMARVIALLSGACPFISRNNWLSQEATPLPSGPLSSAAWSPLASFAILTPSSAPYHRRVWFAPGCARYGGVASAHE